MNIEQPQPSAEDEGITLPAHIMGAYLRCTQIETLPTLSELACRLEDEQNNRVVASDLGRISTYILALPANKKAQVVARSTPSGAYDHTWKVFHDTPGEAQKLLNDSQLKVVLSCAAECAPDESLQAKVSQVLVPSRITQMIELGWFEDGVKVVILPWDGLQFYRAPAPGDYDSAVAQCGVWGLPNQSEIDVLVSRGLKDRPDALEGLRHQGAEILWLESVGAVYPAVALTNGKGVPPTLKERSMVLSAPICGGSV